MAKKNEELKAVKYFGLKRKKLYCTNFNTDDKYSGKIHLRVI